ncbi:tetratricopeptide repeat protein [Roseobacter sp. HKCCA0434]|uniref:tetratricopeptide repeat protein n=1 Tax=Roseobacter sp. HKCCA0434 TaxID=3079297 RepID=UPI002905ECC1|nr:tetratricopeptide repeat protein [Roseobacter sp. HKCCA0434]
MRLRATVILLAGLAALPLQAQDADPLSQVLDGSSAPQATLEDARLSLQLLDQQLQELRQQLVSTGQVAPGVPFDGAALDRLNAIETRIRELTGRIEQIQLDVQRVAEDGGRRVADLDFRLTELEGGDTEFVAPASDLGSQGGGSAPATGTGGDGGAQVAVSEQSAFNAATGLYESGDYAGSVRALETFLETYPGGPLTADARFMTAEAYAAMGQPRDAAVNYLNAYSATPDGARAPEALKRLAGSLGDLGQVTEACLTYDEALNRFADQSDAYITEILTARQTLGCN